MIVRNLCSGKWSLREKLQELKEGRRNFGELRKCRGGISVDDLAHSLLGDSMSLLNKLQNQCIVPLLVIVDWKSPRILYGLENGDHVLCVDCSLRPVDVQLIKHLQSQVNIVPVIAKADTLTSAEVKRLKAQVSRGNCRFMYS